jgi:acetate kinase
MRLLVLNCGSSTVKFQLLETASGDVAAQAVRVVARGMVDRVGEAATLEFRRDGEAPAIDNIEAPDHEAAVHAILSRLRSSAGLNRYDIVAHRVVHGADRFSSAVVIDESVIDALEDLCRLAPLHNPPSVAGIRAARAALGNQVPMVAAFDTSFHRSMPDAAALYAIPQELAARHHIRRYGFHGLAHEYSAIRYREITGVAKEAVDIVTLHLGNGCSACAIRAGESIDTSMGFTPLEGLVMGTRSGDVDPALVSFLAESEGVAAGEVEHWLNKRSGLLGLSGHSSDMRDLSAEYAGSPRARLAVDVFCHRARKYVGAYLAVLGGAQALVFSGGIGEHSPMVREKICSGMEWCGLRLDEERNASAIGTDGRISHDHARIHVYVIRTNEEGVIARQAAALLATNQQRS